MRRRDFLRAGMAGAVVASAGGAVAASARRLPNVLYVFSDQHRAVSMPGEVLNEAMAPNLDRFRKANFSMDRCISNYPLCTPYRGILMSGRWPFQTGLVKNNIALGTDERSLGHHFRGNGYRTAYVGKWHLQGRGVKFVPPGPGRQGFQDWHVWANTNAHYKSWTYDPESGERIQPRGWNCTLMTDQAVSFIDAQENSNSPWFLVVSWNPPHPPFNPPPEDRRRYRGGHLAKRPNARLREEQGENIPRPLHSEAALQKAMAGYYGGITGVDGEFQRLLDILDKTGQAENTIVIYTSDHGEMMGSHGRMAKQVPFEESCRVPFFVRYPGRTIAGGRSGTLFAAIDIYPTLCGLAGVPVPSHCAGRDFSAVMTGGHAQASRSAFLINHVEQAPDAAAREGRKKPRPMRERVRQFVNLPSYRGVRTDTHTYAVAETGRWCLYDNVADPFQTKNLIADPAQRVLMEALDADIMAWLKEANDPFPYAEAVTRVSNFPT